MDFERAHRIHAEHGSLFIDAYLVLHPSELDPANEAALRAKLALTYGIHNPSFFEAPERMAIALGLGQLVPVSLAAQEAQKKIGDSKLKRRLETGIDEDLHRELFDKQHPFAAIVRDTVENPQVDPVGLELLKNGLGVYLLMRQKLSDNHFYGKLSEYVTHRDTPDQVLADLADKIGVSSLQVREAALKGGLDGVGRLLGLDAKYIAEVKEVAEYAATQDFSYNTVEHWHIGHQVLGPDASLQDKLAVGMDRRITAKIAEYRARVNHFYDVPEAIKKTETRIARDDMSVLEPIQRQLMFALGYEICHTPENLADAIAFHKGIYGLHRKTANDLSDIRGTYRIFYSGHGRLENAVGTLAHEVAHNFWPNYFSAEQVTQIDKLVGDDAIRFTRLQRLMDTDFEAFENLLNSYHAGDAQEKAAIIATANERFAGYGVTVDELFPHLTDAKSFRFMVWDAGDVLSIEGGRYQRSGYDSPQERFREVISRFAEMRQVSHRDQPQVMRFLAPGLTAMWEQHYIPHLERVYQDVIAQQRGEVRLHGVDATIATNVRSLVHPANDDVPGEAQPKVEEHPQPVGTPLRPAAAADSSDAPKVHVLASSIHHNANTMAALGALKDMGIVH